MLAAERLNRIVEITNERQLVTFDELIKELGSSKSTLHRDINRLSDMGLLKKTHGGVMSVKQDLFLEPPLRVKSNLHIEEKRRIAGEALKYLSENDHVIFDSGTTILELAKMLDGRKPLTVVTYDLLIAMEVAKHPAIDLLMVGGMLRKSYYSFFGHFAESMFKQVTVSKAFISADTVDLQKGLMSYTADDIAIKQQIIDAANEVVLLCDHFKFETKSFLCIRGLDCVDKIITGVELKPEIHKRLLEAGIDVVLV